MHRFIMVYDYCYKNIWYKSINRNYEKSTQHFQPLLAVKVQKLPVVGISWTQFEVTGRHSSLKRRKRLENVFTNLCEVISEQVFVGHYWYITIPVFLNNATPDVKPYSLAHSLCDTWVAEFYARIWRYRTYAPRYHVGADCWGQDMQQQSNGLENLCIRQHVICLQNMGAITIKGR